MKKLIEGKISTGNGEKLLVGSMTITDYPETTEQMTTLFDALPVNSQSYMLSGMFAKLIVSAQQPLRDATRFEDGASYTVAQVVESLASSAKISSFKSQITAVETKIAVINGILVAISSIPETEDLQKTKEAEKSQLEKELTNLLALEANRPKRAKKKDNK